MERKGDSDSEQKEAHTGAAGGEKRGREFRWGWWRGACVGSVWAGGLL